MIIFKKECYKTFMTRIALSLSLSLWRQLSVSGSFNLDIEKQLRVNIDFKSTLVPVKPAAWQPAVFN